MNKDKAIQLLERLQDPEPYDPMLTKDAYDAIQMAIDALSADGDMISRKVAIDALTDENIINHMDSVHDSELHRCKRAFERILSQLPPTQPKTYVDDIACENCEYSERFVDGLILCRRAKTSHRVSATSTCGKGKREVTT